MANKSYLKGRRRENYIRSKYEALGYACIRSSGSKGAVDVIAIKKGPWCEKMGNSCPLIHAVQCKPRNCRPRKADREKMRAWSEKTGIEVKVE